MKILAIDPANETGWAVNENVYGIQIVKIRKGESRGIKWLRFEKWLREMIELFDIQLIATERPGGRHSYALMHHAQLNSCIEKVCCEKGIEYITKSSKEIKKFATGKGNANKDQMVLAARYKYLYDGDNDNIADALHLLHLVKHSLGLC